MRKHRKKRGVAPAAVVLVVAIVASLALAASASAKLVGEYTKFQNCPFKTAGVERCIQSVTEGGTIVLGKKTVTIEKAVTLQGGYPEAPEEGPEAGFSKLVAATNGQTLTKAAQNVPGGLLGIVPPESSPPLVKALSKFFFENALTGVTSTLELAKSASDVKVSELHLAEGEGIALVMPVKVHLENPFLGKSCFVGSSSSPITWNLTSGTTVPPKGTEPISGKIGEVDFIDGGRILHLIGNELVDNTWSAPTASGCGGILSFLVNPIINTQVGLSSPAGKNSTRLVNSIYEATAAAVNKNDKENP
jgi:hypothetical protein